MAMVVLQSTPFFWEIFRRNEIFYFHIPGNIQANVLSTTLKTGDIKKGNFQHVQHLLAMAIAWF